MTGAGEIDDRVPAAPDARSAVAGSRIVAMRRRHLRGVQRIERTTVHARWSPGLFLNELAAPNRCYLSALGPAVLGSRRSLGPPGQVLGYAGLLLAGPDAHVTTVAVRPDLRRASIGSRLLLVLARVARARGSVAMTLEVAASNGPAIALYERFGFVVEGVRENYYAELGEDALVLWWTGLDGVDAGRRLDEIEAALDPPLATEGIDW